jgi:hypothetical protein
MCIVSMVHPFVLAIYQIAVHPFWLGLHHSSIVGITRRDHVSF